MLNYRFIGFSIVLSAFVLSSCGEWKAAELFITVRTKVEKEWVFISDTATITIKINSDHSVSGTIGKIFPDDPLNTKEVELYLGPLEGNRIDTELRFTEGGAHFPMAGMLLMKDDDL